jgi:hypothetical protein
LCSPIHEAYGFEQGVLQPERMLHKGDSRGMTKNSKPEWVCQQDVMPEGKDPEEALIKALLMKARDRNAQVCCAISG